MSQDSRQQARFIKGIGLIVLCLMGIVPLLVVMAFGVVIFSPYASIVSLIAGAYILNHGNMLTHLGEAHDR